MVGQASSDFRVRSWSLDHSYTNKKYSAGAMDEHLREEDINQSSKSRGAKKRGCLVQSRGVDYRSVAW